MREDATKHTEFLIKEDKKKTKNQQSKTRKLT